MLYAAHNCLKVAKLILISVVVIPMIILQNVVDVAVVILLFLKQFINS